MHETKPSRTAGHRWVTRYGYYNGNAYGILTRMRGTEMTDRFISVSQGTGNLPGAAVKYEFQHGAGRHTG